MHYYSIPRDQGAGSHVDWKVVAEKLSQLDRSFALRALPFIYAHSASSLLYLQLSYSAAHKRWIILLLLLMCTMGKIGFKMCHFYFIVFN